MALDYGITTTREDLEQILRLQALNHLTRVSEETKEQEGFVTVRHTYDILEKMHLKCPHIIAKEGEHLAGYALCMHPQFGPDIEVLRPMFREIVNVVPKNLPYMVMGQVCVAREYRKKGVFRKLYQTMSDYLRPKYRAIITEVDERNTRSLGAHYAIGFTDLISYTSGGQDWRLIVLSIP